MSGKKQRGHVPYRDRASQSLMKKMHEREPASQDPEEVASHGTQEEPEVEPDEGLPRASDFLDIPETMMTFQTMLQTTRESKKTSP